MKQEIVLSIMGVIVSIELVCGALIILRAFLAGAFSPIQPRIVDDVVIHNRPTALSKSVRPEPVPSEPVRPSGSNVSIRVEARGEVAVQIDIGSGVVPDVKSQADVRDVAPDDPWSDF